MNSEPSIRIVLDSAAAHYQPGDRLSGRFLVEGTQMRTLRAAELSVLWYTAGKGEEDFAVHHFERHVDEASRPLDLRVPHRFTTLLPASPLSYDGDIVKVCWCVRVRLFMPAIHSAVAELPFRLGSVAVGSAVAPAEPEPDA
ncbi:MAG TPA: hypothetical protein VHU84_07800 [Lacipirellulaceae bacterium]|jgi:hypothetical protein|nr:hypothetical protein [Lacipirellulaceae bacterium]